MASRLRVAVPGLLVVASLAGCVSMPSGGPVLSYSITQSPGGQSQAFIQRIAQPPQPHWSPMQIVEGFIAASGSLNLRTAQEYLTPAYSKEWTSAGWSATVYSKGPSVEPVSTPAEDPNAKSRHSQTAVVRVTGAVQANVFGSSGNYAVASAKSPKSPQPLYFKLVRAPGAPWRISHAPKRLLLTSATFALDYQQRNLYFFDPDYQVLVPDPVYVPLSATPAELMHNLVNDLNAGPAPGSWLAGATETAFTSLTRAKVGDVTLDGGIATVTLTTTSKQPTTALQQIYAQLFWTLVGSGQGSPAVQQVALVVNGKPWSATGTQDNSQTTPAYSPPQSATTGEFYYLDSAGYLVQQNGAQGAPHKIGPLGKGFTQIAVSPPVGADGVQYLAALRGGAKGGDTLYTGLVGGKLVKRGAGYTSMSWAPDGYLWTTTIGGQIARLRGNASPAKPAGQPQPVTVQKVAGSFTAIRVAPDGVRVALIAGGSVLDFGAIKHLAGARASEQDIQITPSPYNVAVPGITLTTVTWYGPDNVITLGTLGAGRQVLTEYAVNGGGSASIPPPPRVQTITAAGASHSLIAGVATSGVWSDASLTGAWAPIILNANAANSVQLRGISPVYPG